MNDMTKNVKVPVKGTFGYPFFSLCNSLIFPDQFGVSFIKIEEWERE